MIMYMPLPIDMILNGQQYLTGEEYIFMKKSKMLNWVTYTCRVFNVFVLLLDLSPFYFMLTKYSSNAI